MYSYGSALQNENIEFMKSYLKGFCAKCIAKSVLSDYVDAKGCIRQQNTTDKYLGLRNFTYEGYRCLHWIEGNGIPSGRLKMAREHGVFGTNYCRNFFSEKEGPWCYIERDGEVVQQSCFRTCEERSKLDLEDNPCFSSSSDTLPKNMPTLRQRSNRDVPCLRWHLLGKGGPDDNFCRVSSELDGMPGCYEATTQELRSCYTPCPGEEGDEFFFASEEPGCVPEKDRLAWYSGKRSITLNNNPCEYWDVISKAGLASMKGLLSLYRLHANKMEDAANYCRNLDYDPKGPWCMTVHKHKEYCFPRCSDTSKHSL
ncbi:Kringle domain containing protein [Trichuris trichiura]|uniref:Kringle domain containing protein n=1 Tax=Trichuris trichiura TaxID=36087 RepID=A0A077ZGN3_TRITR|nr:Kringle domain containing protein [Trichuris trichiura]